MTITTVRDLVFELLHHGWDDEISVIFPCPIEMSKDGWDECSIDTVETNGYEQVAIKVGNVDSLMSMEKKNG